MDSNLYSDRTPSRKRKKKENKKYPYKKLNRKEVKNKWEK